MNYKEFAEECENMAKTEKDPEIRKALDEMAFSCMIHDLSPEDRKILYAEAQKLAPDANKQRIVTG